MPDPLDTHSYDGQLSKNLLPRLAEVEILTIDEKRKRGQELLDACISSGIIRPMALHYLRCIINSIGNSSNVDRTNKLIADDLISLCWLHRENTEFLTVLETQLLDMGSGFCPQGRTHRLFQLLCAFT